MVSVDLYLIAPRESSELTEDYRQILRGVAESAALVKDEPGACLGIHLILA